MPISGKPEIDAERLRVTGLVKVPAIHVFATQQDVDARFRGHDEK